MGSHAKSITPGAKFGASGAITWRHCMESAPSDGARWLFSRSASSTPPRAKFGAAGAKFGASGTNLAGSRCRRAGSRCRRVLDVSRVIKVAKSISNQVDSLENRVESLHSYYCTSLCAGGLCGRRLACGLRLENHVYMTRKFTNSFDVDGNDIKQGAVHWSKTISICQKHFLLKLCTDEATIV